MFSHLTIKVTMMFLAAVVLVNLANYIFYVYYNPNAEGPVVMRRPIATARSESGAILVPKYGIRQKYFPNNNVGTDKLCPAIPPGLGPITSNKTMFDFPNENSFSAVVGGYNKMKTCVPREKAAVIVLMPHTAADYPFELINYLHSFLRKQMLEYQVIVLKQTFMTPFHRGKLINAAFATLFKVLHKSFDCIIVHDPDILPTDTRNIYRCGWYPRQLVATLEKDYRVTSYENDFGGAIAISRGQFEKINGFSNVIENNDVFLDFTKRLAPANYIIERTPSTIGSYITLKTIETVVGTEHSTAQDPPQSSLEDGLSSVTYLLEKSEEHDTFLYLQISLPDNKPRFIALPTQSNMAKKQSLASDEDLDIKAI